MKQRTFDHIYGVDFSGAKKAGENIWVAHATPRPDRVLEIQSLDRLESLAGTSLRDPALAHLVSMIGGSKSALWGIDFPFSLPIELFEGTATATAPGVNAFALASFEKQMALVREWKSDAYDFGLHCVDRAKQLKREMHIRRDTDRETFTPFDCYHYRIIYQTFHGMRDVLGALETDRRTAVIPFHYDRLPRAKRVVVESCPSSTLKRLKLPHQNYKQPAGGPLTPLRRRVRHAILKGLAEHVIASAGHLRTIMRNGGGDALDAVIAAVGTWAAWRRLDHRAIRKHARYPLEGIIFS